MKSLFPTYLFEKCSIMQIGENKNKGFVIFTKPLLYTGTPDRIRTYDPRIRSPLLYPTELLAHMERVMGIEPT